MQGVLETAIQQVTRTWVRVTGSGRTDAGVHAAGQVIGFQSSWKHTWGDMQRALNAVLPPDVAVREVEQAAPGWHPRFSAVRRHYRYQVFNRPLRSPLHRRYMHHVPQPLDLGALQAGTAWLIGEHDFGSFGRPTQGTSTIRRIESACWSRDETVLTFDVIGNAFLRGMVRSLVGNLLMVGVGAWPAEQIGAVLAAHNRAAAAAPAPACGLCLLQVDYE